MGKWSGFKDKIAPTTYEDEVLAAASSYAGQSTASLTQQFNAEREAKEHMEEELRACNLRLRGLEIALIRELESRGETTVVVNGYSWTVSPEPVAAVDDRAALRTWAETTMPDILSVYYQTLQGLVKDALLKGEALPAGVSVTLRTSISRRKA